jgi:hypothetical protein
MRDKLMLLQESMQNLSQAEQGGLLEILTLLEKIACQIPQEKIPSMTEYQQLVQLVLQSPYKDYLMSKLIEPLEKEAMTDIDVQGSSQMQALQLKMHPTINSSEKNQRMLKALLFFQNRKTQLSHNMLLQTKGQRPDVAPKILAALDTILDLISSFFAEPPRKNKLTPLPTKPRPVFSSRNSESSGH